MEIHRGPGREIQPFGDSPGWSVLRPDEGDHPRVPPSCQRRIPGRGTGLGGESPSPERPRPHPGEKIEIGGDQFTKQEARSLEQSRRGCFHAAFVRGQRCAGPVEDLIRFSEIDTERRMGLG